MMKRFLAVLIAMCLMIPAISTDALANESLVLTDAVDAEVMETGADGDDGEFDLVTDDDLYTQDGYNGLAAPVDDECRELGDVDLNMCDDEESSGQLIFGTEVDDVNPDEAGANQTDCGTLNALTAAPYENVAMGEKTSGDENNSDSEANTDENGDEAENSSDEKTDDTSVETEGADDEENTEEANDGKPEGDTETAPGDVSEEEDGEATEETAADDSGEEGEEEMDGEPAAQPGDASEEKEEDEADGETDQEEDGESGNKGEDVEKGEDGEKKKGGEPGGEDEDDGEDEQTSEGVKADSAAASDEKSDSEEGAEGKDEADGEEKDKADAEAKEADTGDAEGEDAGAQEAQAEPAAALILNQTAVTLLPQENCTLVASGGTGAVSWSSENAGVASVDAQGLVTAVAAGSTNIIATDEKGVTAACAVSVVDVPDDVAFATDTLVIGLNEKRALPGFVWAGGTKSFPGTATYTTGNRRKVSVTADGKIKGVARGSAVITATLSNGKTVQCTVTVKKAPTRIKLTEKRHSMGVGESAIMGYTLPTGCGGTVTWSSGNPAVASVDPATGVITANAPGTANITARTYNNKRASAKVCVYAAPASVAFNSRVITVGLGETISLKASVNDGAYSSFSFATSDGGIAPVSGDKVTGAALGETQVVVTTYNNLQDTATIVVKPAPTAIALPYKVLRIGRGDRVQLAPDFGGGASSLRCTSSKKKVVKVTDGVVQGLQRGTAYVTIRTYNNLRTRLKVVVKRAPGWIKATPNPLNLGVGETYTLGYKTPKGTAGSVRFTGDAPSVFSVNETTGAITGLAPGAGTVTLTSYNGKVSTCPVTVYAAPTSVAFDPSQTGVGKKQKLQLQMVFSEGSWSNITYEVENPKIAKVSATGLVTGVSVGQTVIRARTFVPGVMAETVFTVWGAPKRVWLDKKSMTANVGEPFQLEPRIPAGSRTTFKYKSSKKKVAKVSADGVVTPLKKGKTKITITTHNKKKCTLTLKVVNPGNATALSLRSTNIPVLHAGETWQVEYDITPASAAAHLVWTSSNPAVASVDANGLITALSYGTTEIKAVPTGNKKLSIKFTLYVQTKELSLDIPARTTNTAGIAENLAKINAIKNSALQEITRLTGTGELTADTAARRQAIVEAIFENYAFPWMTPTLQKYWKAANSENGAKDFKADRVYYGMPYISGSGANRRYSAAKAVAEGRYTDSGQGYYLLNQSNYLNGKYVGNDCSGLVNVAIWGVNSAHSADRTADIAKIDAYYTVGSYDSMLPGDLICKGEAHVVMFLYYASDDKSKIMIIENGGSEKGTNTVHCSVMTAASYRKSGYSVRRLSGL